MTADEQAIRDDELRKVIRYLARAADAIAREIDLAKYPKYPRASCRACQAMGEYSGIATMRRKIESGEHRSQP